MQVTEAEVVMKKKILIAVGLLLLIGATISQVLAQTKPQEQAFYALWGRTDALVAEEAVARTWYWGPSPFATLDEEYRQGIVGKRQVMYWDKGRMEITNPNEDPTSSWYVTAGMLSIEMISGSIRVGDDETVALGTVQVSIAGDPDRRNASAPTYASFGPVTTANIDSRMQIATDEPLGPTMGENTAPPRQGELVDEALNRNSEVSHRPDLAAAYPETRLVYYDSVLGHNIPRVFWEFLQKVGKVQINGEQRQDLLIDWQYVMGHPASEPYWVRTRVNHVERDVLVQVYERRILTYNPSNPIGWRVEMGNVGQHYYKWRYGHVTPYSYPEQRQQSTSSSYFPPNNFTATVEPREGPSGTDYLITLLGFRRGEPVSIWVTLPDQTVIEAPEMGIGTENGVAMLQGKSPFYLTTNAGDPEGVWAVTGQGNESGHTSIAYFVVKAP